MRTLAYLLEEAAPKKILAVDFDGTIAKKEYSGIVDKLPKPEEEVEGALAALKELQEVYTIILWTCRDGAELGDALAWLRDRGFTPDAVNKQAPGVDFTKSPKVFADYYLDDKSFPPFPGWAEARKQLLKAK